MMADISEVENRWELCNNIPLSLLGVSSIIGTYRNKILRSNCVYNL